MAYRVYKCLTTGVQAIASSLEVPPTPNTRERRLTDVHVHFDIAPAAAGNLTVTLDAAAGAVYDTLLRTDSMVGLTDYVWHPDEDLWLQGGDAIDVAYANGDGRTYGCTITMVGDI